MVEVASDVGDAPIGPGSADMVVVLGGDGSFLGAARRLAQSKIPVVGVNLGRLGFLTEFNPKDFFDLMGDILAGKLTALPRMMLNVTVCRGARPCFSSPAMNDVSIVAGEPFRMIELNVRHREVEVCTFLGDGLIVSTPSGSTAYTLSAGGPILMPSMQAMVMTPLAAHNLYIRPVVLTSEYAVQIRPLRANPGTTASIDGQLRCPLAVGDIIEVVASQNYLWVVQNPRWPFFRTLRTKMNWGANPSGMK
jgi:NAD+ kinase